MAQDINVAVVVGNPRARGRTWDAAHRIGAGLGRVTLSIDVVDFGPGLLAWDDEAVREAVRAVASHDVVVVGSPTYKAAYSGILKLFLDKFEGGSGLAGVVAVPFQLGGSPAHALAPEVHLRPVLTELGASVPAPALYLLDRAVQPDEVETAWIDRWSPVVGATARSTRSQHSSERQQHD